ncbi:hypothetical protein [Petrachloros mirabilis]
MVSYFHRPAGKTGVTLCTMVVVLLLCFGVFMQMLGVPVTLWDVDNAVDVDYLSFLEGLAIPAESPLMGPAQFLSRDRRMAVMVHSLLRDHSVFHPPTAISISLA